MATKKQLDANRLNAQLSTGPRTEQGKAISRRNALKHGIDSVYETISGENSADLAALAAEYDREWEPRGLAERVLVDLLVRKDWLLRRYGFLSAQLTNYGVVVASKTREGSEFGAGFAQNYEANHRLHRHSVETERSYMSHLAELEKRQAERRQHQAAVATAVSDSSERPSPEIGSVSPTSPLPIRPAPTPSPSPAIMRSKNR